MPPAQHRCGDIVWQCKRHVRSFAFKCVFCSHYTTSTFRDFKGHLEAEHLDRLRDFETEESQQKQSALPPSLSSGRRSSRSTSSGVKLCDPVLQMQNNTFVNKVALGTPELQTHLPMLDPGSSSDLVDFPSDPLENISLHGFLSTNEDPEPDIDIEMSEFNVKGIDAEFYKAPKEELEESESAAGLEAELDWFESNDSFTTLEDATEDDDELPADTKHFWLREHPIMFAIIDHYKKARPLWDVRMVTYRNRGRRNVTCEQIADKLNAQFGLRLECEDIVIFVNKLRAAYYREERRAQSSTAITSDLPWYYDHLNFLKDGEKQRGKRGKRGTKALTSKGSALPVPQLSHAQNRALIEIYRRCNRTWDMQDLTYRLRHIRQQANDNLLQLCRDELKVQINPKQLQRYIYRIRYAYTQEKTRQLQCERDGRPYVPICPYYKQIQFLEQHVGPFKCEVCEAVINGVDGFKVHRSQHDGSMPFLCPICQRGFSRSGNCTIHLRRHTQDFHVSCDQCGKRFATTSDMQVHRRNHTGEKPYCCDVCGQRFRTSSFFDRHKRRHEQRPKGKCHICGKHFFEQSVLNDHIKAHLNVRDKVCDVCQKAFTSAKYLRQHKEIHAAKKRYMCKICGKCFAQYAGLNGHMKSHGTTMREAAQMSIVFTKDPEPDLPSEQCC
ncbi:zinc finger protein 836-like [Scaptodrosophila lebanonensis]|uniref:Zinc finger protein 836-like n=1 Tax=Drosophila lebanonensis TaxID=7225 RepID=A0A6J2TZG3_DROLE|nr:zinc finger protein 836-like [Scaptodrosophila lebanonensis]